MRTTLRNQIFNSLGKLLFMAHVDLGMVIQG